MKIQRSKEKLKLQSLIKLNSMLNPGPDQDKIKD